MKVSDYIVEYLIMKGISDVFGYPGGMVTHLMDSFRKYKPRITAHMTYHEQGAAFAACGYAQVSGKPGVAYATSGPGATNLITGICNAFFDSIPCVFITGQVNTFEAKGELGVRQRGFQETDIVSMVSGVTKFAAYVEHAEQIRYYLDRAFDEAMGGRRGPVLLDIPMDIFRTEINPAALERYEPKMKSDANNDIIKYFSDELATSLQIAEHPCIIIGNGIKSAGLQNNIKSLAVHLGLPIVSSMPAFDVLAGNPVFYGFIGAYGDRTANFILSKSDLIIAIGTRLDIRQVGAKRENFAPAAKLIRVDIDEGELSYRVHENERQFHLQLNVVIEALDSLALKKDYRNWLTICKDIKWHLKGMDEREPNRFIRKISEYLPDDAVITTDVGQNQVWVAQSLQVKSRQSVLFSSGHGSMGFSLPAAIGAWYGSHKPIICFCGDGGFQMNIQELQFIARDKLPIKIIVMNNSALGMIRHFQEMFFEKRYYQTNEESGYTVPDFCKIAQAYGLKAKKIYEVDDVDEMELTDLTATLYEIILHNDTYVFPKLEFGKPNQDQEPLIDRKLYAYLTDLGK